MKSSATAVESSATAVESSATAVESSATAVESSSPTVTSMLGKHRMRQPTERNHRDEDKSYSK
jgi:hypothetical protein